VNTNRVIGFLLTGLSLFLFQGCGQDTDIDAPFILELNCGAENALAECLTPQFSPEYYIDQGVKYFLTMESTVPIDVRPEYADRVVRWEWPPWLLLTGYTRAGLVWSDIFLKLNPTAYDLIDCRFFEQQPFCRCHVIFNYSGELCPIYEEFTFNDQGEITFIEAWSDYESLLPMGPGTDGIWDEEEYWGKYIAGNRLATRVPGLGNSTGNIDLYAGWMVEAAENDADLADMVFRARQPVATWLAQLLTHSDDLAGGCYAPEGDIYPYYTP
jgi:hypothetical protein